MKIDPLMMLFYMHVLCKREPLFTAIADQPSSEMPGWIGLFGGGTVSTQASNDFLLEHLNYKKYE